MPRFPLTKSPRLTCCTTRPLSSSRSLMLRTSCDVTAFIENPGDTMRSGSRVGTEPCNTIHHFPPVDHVIHLSKQTESNTVVCNVPVCVCEAFFFQSANCTMRQQQVSDSPATTAGLVLPHQSGAGAHGSQYTCACLTTATTNSFIRHNTSEGKRQPA